MPDSALIFKGFAIDCPASLLHDKVGKDDHQRDTLVPAMVAAKPLPPDVSKQEFDDDVSAVDEPLNSEGATEAATTVMGLPQPSDRSETGPGFDDIQRYPSSAPSATTSQSQVDSLVLTSNYLPRIDSKMALSDSGPSSSKSSINDAERPSTPGSIDETPVEQEPQAPYHIFQPRMVIVLVAMVSGVATLSGLSSNIYFPSQAAISSALDISPEIVNLSITTYMIAQGLGPSFWGPLADHTGRRMTLIYTLIVYIGANIALALTSSGPMLLVFRALQAIGSSSTIALGAGVIADISPPSERGGYIGWFSGIRQLSLALGPVLGGILGQFLGWRSIFWFLVILSSLLVLMIIFLLPETLRRIAGNGSSLPHTWMHRPLAWSIISRGLRPGIEDPEAAKAKQKRLDPISWRTFLGPFLLLLEKDVACALFFGGCVYTAWSMMVASTTYLLKATYQFNTLQIGVSFLANGLGCVAGSVLAGRSLNSDFHREASLWHHVRYMPPTTPLPSKPLPLSFPIERARLSRGFFYGIVAIWSFMLFGWSLTTPEVTNDAKAHWLTPLLAQAAAGWSATSILTSNNALLVDLYPDKAASASAVLNLSRCLLAAAGVACADPLLQVGGPGWFSVTLACIVAFGMIAFVLHYNYGQLWRKQRLYSQRSEAEIHELQEHDR